MSEQVYETPDSLNAPADFKTWCHHVDHHMTTLFGIDAREAGFDKDELRNIHKKCQLPATWRNRRGGGL